MVGSDRYVSLLGPVSLGDRRQIADLADLAGLAVGRIPSLYIPSSGLVGGRRIWANFRGLRFASPSVKATYLIPYQWFVRLWSQ